MSALANSGGPMATNNQTSATYNSSSNGCSSVEGNNGINPQVGTANSNNINNSGNGGAQNANNNTSPAHLQHITPPVKYTLPGVLHYIQCEWQRFENDRHQWEIERYELNARIALLQGERKGQENLKSDLVRRIKMLEYCLRQERAKYHKLKYGVDAPTLDNIPVDRSIINSGDGVNDNATTTTSNLGANCDTGNNPDTGADGVNWMLGRQLLRQYLQEIGYTDSIIDVRSSRVRSLLGLINMRGPDENEDEAQANIKVTPDPDPSKQQQITNDRRKQHHSPAMPVVSEAESSVLATLGFLEESARAHGNTNYDQMNEDSEDDEEEDVANRTSLSLDSETENVLAEFDFLSSPRANKDEVSSCWRPSSSGKDMVDMGDLAALTVTNESLDVNGSAVGSDDPQDSTGGEHRKQWSPRFSLKSHFDCVRSLRFHAEEPLLVTCSQDETLKLWNLSRTSPPSNKGKQQASQGATTFDLEPIHTYRGHTSAVLSLELINNTIYSGAQNGELFIWLIPSNIANIDPFDNYNPLLMAGSLIGHTDAIWSIVSLPSTGSGDIICSASSDLSIKVWSSSSKKCIKNITWQDNNVRPTCLASILPHCSVENSSSASLLAASFTDGSISIYDIESSNINQPALTLKSENSSRINSITVHPTMPIMVSAHQDRQIKFWDLSSGKCVHEMVAHLDEVTCVACDPNGLHLLSGSHDCSVRLWDFDNRTCIQEITSHRKKFDEAIFDVTFHPTKPFFASAGADALVKVFI
ncbi:connector of kinase to AP-1 [Brevipalpus obovatus]|uniref:connector of kinase to AP-1 n=1 Tax=Brevipalpus obovatus TaxID=246614 RepID=UPI003D9E4D48